MEIKIPNELVYFGAGVVAGRAIKSIFGTSLSDIVNNALYEISELQRLSDIEKRIVVDVNGDTVGYFDGNTIKRWIE